MNICDLGKMNIDIYMPRLDVTFKKGPVPQQRTQIKGIRVYWQLFAKRLKEAHENIGDKTRILEVPLWQITESLVGKVSTNAHKIYIPHKMRANCI